MALRHGWLGALIVGGWGALAPLAAAPRSVVVQWDRPDQAGRVTIERGVLVSMDVGKGIAVGNTFDFATATGRMVFVLDEPGGPEALPALVTVKTGPRGFTFRVADVDANYPIYLPADAVVVTPAPEQRTFAEIVAAIRARGTQTKLQRIAAAPEESFATAAAATREVKVQTWLGVGRDIRLFRVDEHLDHFEPRFAGFETKLAEAGELQVAYAFQLGRGWGLKDDISRRLDDGTLPILHGRVDDEGMSYEVTMFAAPERSAFTAENIRGTDFLVANAHSHGAMFTPPQKAEMLRRREAEMNPPEEIVLYARAVATNRGATPAYALLKTVTPTVVPTAPPVKWTFDAAHGAGVFASGRVFAVGKLNGRLLRAEENTVLLKPGETAVLEFFVPHRPIDLPRAAALAGQSFDARLAEARAFWRAKLAAAAQWRLPEARIQEMVRAGLLHLDLVAYGREPKGPLLPAVGIYAAIGSESAPIIQFMDAMGWHETAARALDFFLEKQHDDGFMQNFNGYMLETGAVLWTMGEHYRYTRDEAWLRRVHPKITLACEYLRAWRQRNLAPGPDGNGAGMLDGKTADPDDPYRSFMLNGYAYLGLSRAAEILRASAPDEAAKWAAEAAALKESIRTALGFAVERSPVVALGDGTWARAAPPWTNYRGPVMLHTDGGSWFTHGTMTARDSALGPLWLVFQEVIDPSETMATEILETHAELMTRENVAFSQPYYSRHPWVHLERGEPKAFLKAWYGTVAALADRGTYTFTEHFFPVSAHKTHEEAWFLMETRWMLYLEAGDTLRLLAGAPRAWLAPGANVAVEGAASYFGKLSFNVTAAADGKSIRAIVECPEARRPRVVEIRLPHASGRRAVAVEGGTYSAERESVTIAAFSGRAEVVVRF